MKGFIRKLYSLSEKINERFIYKAVLIVCAAIHAVFVAVFADFGAVIMTVFNMLSVVLYICLYFMVSKSDLRIIGTLTYLEISIHSVLATITIGWDYGFALFLICIVPLAFYLPYSRMRTSLFLCVCPVIMFVSLKLFTCAEWFVPKIDTGLNVSAINGFYSFNSMVSFIMLIVLSLIFNLSTKRAERLLRQKNEKLEEFAYTDPLTKLKNRRSMFTEIQKSFDLAAQNATAFSIVLSDIDDFKNVNDTYGHNCGDMILQNVSEIFRKTVPENASVCRWGGEEILVLLPDCPLEQGAEIADEIRRAVESEHFEVGAKSFGITMTFGVSENRGQISVDKMISNADKNLYSGKRSGKNCIIC